MASASFLKSETVSQFSEQLKDIAMQGNDIAEDAFLALNPSVLLLDEDETITAFMGGNKDADSVRKFSGDEVTLLKQLVKGGRKLELRAMSGLDTNVFANILAELRDWGDGALEWRDSDEALAHKVQKQKLGAAQLRDIALALASRESQNDDFHRKELHCPERQFDEIETTISHVFREPHPALSGNSFGQIFCHWLVETGQLYEGCRIIEIGCGLGLFAKAILDELAKKHPVIYASITYTLFDLSPALQAAQRKNCAAHLNQLFFLQGNIETYDFGSSRYDLILSNEVIADLSVGTISIENVAQRQPASDAECLASRYDLECVPVRIGGNRLAIINSGAIKMLENIYYCMDAGSNAVITEYGSNGQSPKAVQFANHLEFTVNFEHLIGVADSLGFRSHLSTMGETMGFDETCETVRMESFRTLCGQILPFLGRDTLPMLAYTSEMLNQELGEISEKILNIGYLPLIHPNAFSPFRFELLQLKKESV